MLASLKFRPGIIALVLIFAACSPGKKVSLAEKNFGDEIETRQNLVFTFDRELAPDSVLNLWDSVSYISFTPEVQGSFKWISGKELVFSPSSEFRPATAYSARLNASILRFTNTDTEINSGEKIEFRTPYLKSTADNAWWSLAEDDPGMIALNLSFNFNYHIDPAVISKYLEVNINNKQAAFKISDHSVSSTLTVKSAAMSKELLDGCTITYTFKPGATCQACGSGIPEAITATMDVKAPDHLEITHMEGILDNGTGIIKVYCNQEILVKELSKQITISPKVKFTVEPEGNGFNIMGAFEAGGSYQVDISKSLSGALGGSMQKDFTAMVPFGEMEPAIAFASSKGGYMSTLSSKKISINITNIPRVTVRIFKIYENNIQSFMNYHRHNEYYEDEESYGYGYSEYNLKNLGDEIMNQEYETKNLAKQNGSNLLSLDFTANNQHSGIYLVSIASVTDRWIKATKLISISDIGLIARQSKDEVYVFANSIKEAIPVRGAKITFISTNNQQLHTAVTDNEGRAVFKGITGRYPGFTVGMITARHTGDFNYMSFNDTRVEDSRFDVGGKTNNPSGYEAYIYGDREIYRPGETVYFNTIIRNQGMEILSKVPLKIKILMPNGREYMNIRKTLDSQGAAEASFVLNTSAVTGTWSMEVYSANDVLLNSRNFSVEEFIPDRISISSKTSSAIYVTGDSVKCEATAMNLFGTPASQRNYEMEFSLRKKTIQSKKFPEHNFTVSGADNITFNTILRQGKTDTSGRAVEYFPLNENYSNTGLLDGRIYITVFDETGRPVNRVQQFDVSTQKVYFGIKLSDYYNVARQPMNIEVAAADAKGNAAATSSGNVQVIRVYWETVMEHTYDSRYRYVSQKREKILIDKQLTVPAKGTSFSFTPQESGEYYVRMRSSGSTTWVQSEFYAYGYGFTQSNAFEVNNEGQVDMEFDKKIYEPGDKAKILFKTPFAGKILVTVERDRVYDSFYITTDKRSASINIPIKEEYLPNAYITATLIRPLDEGVIPITIAHGFAPLPVEKKSNYLPVEIKVAEKSRSNTRQIITVQTLALRDVEVTVAVVDEGIMQLKNSKTPDPYAWFYQKRALEVTAFDIYPYVLPDIKLKRSSTGGDGYDLQKRVNPLTNKRVKLVAYWSGILHTDGNGVATCSVEIPQFSGDLRVMAVAYKDKSFGSDEKHIKVSDPIVISPSMPRFLTPGDTLIMPVTITNTTGKTQNVTVSIEKSGPISLSGTASRSIVINANQEERPVFELVTGKVPGEAVVSIKVNNGTETFSDKTDITIRPPASLQKISGAGEITAGATQKIAMTNNFIANTRSGKLIISKSPVVQFSDQLSYLLSYPYGCVEQTVSAAFPQLYYTSLAKAVVNNPGVVVKISENVNAAIRKLQSMQQYNGALSYWPGGNEASWWGSAYAFHFLQEARKAGYEVPVTTTDKLNSYLGLQVKKHPVETYYYYNDKGLDSKKTIPSKDIFYSLYLMALYTKADLATMNYYRSKFDELALDSKYLLAASYMACGDRNAYNTLLPKLFEGEAAKRSTGGNFYSYIRDEALALNALLETDPSNIQIGGMVKHLSSQLRTEKYLNTQERAFSFLALGKFMKSAATTNATATLTATGKTIGEFKNEDLVITKGITSGDVSIQITGNGKLFYFWEMEGLTSDGSFKEVDSYLQVRKTFYNRFGQPLKDLKNIKQNDLIVIGISLVNLQRNLVENIVITDLLPAGIEIENPRVAAVPELAWIKNNDIPDHFDIRDDRINYFTSISDKPKYFYYLARAVSTGNFVMGPVSADAMYDGSYHSYNVAGRMIINP